MAFKRQEQPATLPTGKIAASHYSAIGMRIAAPSSPIEPNIEDTLLAASLEGMAGDLRILSLLTDWLEVHSERVNVDRLVRIVAACGRQRVKAYWSSVAKWLVSDTRFKRLLVGGNRMNLLTTGSDFLLQRHGEDVRFANSHLRVPNKTLRHRLQDIMPPTELARRHKAYSHRLIIGPTYRADMWAMVEQEPGISTADLARRAYGSFATAWQVKRDWFLLHGSN